jgi:hypothetical protein
MAGDRLASAAMVTVVADRESDIDPRVKCPGAGLFARRPAQVHLLCRSAQDRALADGGLLFERCAGWPKHNRTTISVPPRGRHGERQASVALRFGAVALRRPKTPAARTLPENVPVWVVDVDEACPRALDPRIDPPEGQERVHWRLLTTHAVATVAEAQQIVA